MAATISKLLGSKTRGLRYTATLPWVAATIENERDEPKTGILFLDLSRIDR